VAIPLTALSLTISAGAYEAAGWGALVVALFVLLAGAPIMAKFWLKTPVREQPEQPVKPVPGEKDHQPES
jgi:hypothetical protein